MNKITTDKASRKAWFIALTGGLFFTFYFMQMTFLNPIAQGLSATFNLSAEQLGSLSSLYLMAVGLMSLPAGVLTDKCAVRPLMLTILACSIISLIMMRFAHSYEALIVIRFIQGLLHAFCLLAGLRLAAQWIPSHQMGTASSLIITIGLLGGAITQPLFLWIYNSFGLANTFLANAFIGVLIWILFFFVIRDNPAAPAHHANSTWRSFAQGLWQSIRKPQNSAAGIYICFMNLPLMIFGTAWGALYLEHVFGMTGEQGTLVLSLVFFGIMAGSPVAGFISDTYRTRKKVLIWGAFATFLIFATLFLLNQPSLLLLSGIFFAIGFISGAQVVAYPMAAESNPPAFASTSLSVVATVLMLGNALCQTLLSKIVALNTALAPDSHEPLYTASSFTHAVWGLAILFVVAGFIALFFKESMVKTQDRVL